MELLAVYDLDTSVFCSVLVQKHRIAFDRIHDMPQSQ